MCPLPDTIRYNIYPSALDAFEGWVSSDAIWEQYWGGSEDPKKTAEEFEVEQFRSLIDKLNRVPFDSEAADKGTAFNEVVDMLILKTSASDRILARSDAQTGMITATMLERPERVFQFSAALCLEFSRYYEGAVPQILVEGVLETKFGKVRLYGYADEVLPDGKCCDIKTTGQYKGGKFRDHAQHLVYPFCLNQMGIPCTEFEYNVTDFKSTFTEHYVYDPPSSVPVLREKVERFIEFIEMHRDIITDKKLFNEQSDD